ncbi:GyrI-like domain-containing protein [Curvivirga sp.]|uniref:GyrI-like domain-containing protein n=1 Tax=Curvivirga sp. TaxID=2856848 RepID=UPI003B59173B
MTIKHEWRKAEKGVYLPKAKPVLVDLAPMNYITIEGAGSPEEERFGRCISVLYPLAYAIKMNLKKLDNPPKGYLDYTVYPLEGFWDLNETAQQNFTGQVNKDDFVYKLMLRQPDFVTREFFDEMKRVVKEKLSRKGEETDFVEHVVFETISEGRSLQMLHVGRFADEDQSFKIMEDYADENGLTRQSKAHKEIYLSDFRKVPEEKLKTVLRFKVV